MTSPVRTFFLIAVCCLHVLLLSGCLQTKELYIGNKVTAEQIPLVKGSTQTGTWETFDLKIAYEFADNGDVLDISGQATLGDHQQMVYDIVKSLDIYLFFLDKDSRVLLTEALDRYIGGSTQQATHFKQSYAIPDNAKAISFGYSGEVSSEADQQTFYLLPLKK